jgi:hypothetical protein
VPTGVTSFTVTVPTIQDTTGEADETVPLRIDGITATGTIVDDDGGGPKPPITGIEPGQPGAGDDKVTEGTALVYTVTLGGPTTAPATYAFTLGGGTAGAGDVGTPVFSNGVTLNPDGTITVPTGVTTFTVTVPTIQDTTGEADETVPLRIDGVTATGTIGDDDGGAVKPPITGIEPGQPGAGDDHRPAELELRYLGRDGDRRSLGRRRTESARLSDGGQGDERPLAGEGHRPRRVPGTRTMEFSGQRLAEHPDQAQRQLARIRF